MENDDNKTRHISDKTRVKKTGGNTTRQTDGHLHSRQPHTSNLSRNLTFQPNAPLEAATQLAPGAIIKQRFKLEKSIGQGGMGTIFLARDLRKEELNDKDPYVAIKFLNEELHTSIEAIVALQREAKKSQTLSHPNIVTVYDFDRENDIFYLSMEYLRGDSLDHYISRKSNRNEKHTTLIRYIEYMARGLAYAHQEGFVHADFKPANVFLTEQEQIKILDFGITQAVRHNLANAHSDNSFFDPASMGAMTPNYASLEMLSYERPIPADDVYALCVVAYELLGGVAPFCVNGRRINARQAFELGVQPQPIPDVPKRVMNAILKGLSFKRDDRFSDAGKFIDAIKPKVKIRQSVIVLISVLLIALVVSWAIAVNKTEAVIGFNDLPVTMNAMIDTIKTADKIYEQGDIDQSHKLYVQAWEAAKDSIRADSRDLFKLKVILDRRIDKIIENFIDQTEAKDLSLFSALQLQMTLEFLQKSELGTQDDKITKSLTKLQKRIDSKNIK